MNVLRVVYELPQDSTQVGEECPICFDEFSKGKECAWM